MLNCLRKFKRLSRKIKLLISSDRLFFPKARSPATASQNSQSLPLKNRLPIWLTLARSKAYPNALSRFWKLPIALLNCLREFKRLSRKIKLLISSDRPFSSQTRSPATVSQNSQSLLLKNRLPILLILARSKAYPSVLSRFGTTMSNAHRHTAFCAFSNLRRSPATIAAVVAK